MGHGFDPWFRKIPHASGQQCPCITPTEPVSPRAQVCEGFQNPICAGACYERDPCVGYSGGEVAGGGGRPSMGEELDFGREACLLHCDGKRRK